MSSQMIDFTAIMRASRRYAREQVLGYRVMENSILPRGGVFLVIDPTDPAPSLLTFWAHPSDALWLLHPHSPVISRRTLGHRELERDRRRHPVRVT